MKLLEKLIKKPSIFQRTLGLTIKQFEILVASLEQVWLTAESKRKARDNRVRNIGAGHPYNLPLIREKLVTVLLYYKAYLTQEFIGLLVGMDQSNVSRLLAKMLPLIEQAAAPEMKEYLARAKEEYDKQPQGNRINNWQDFLKKHPDLKEVSTDATEQRCHRSSNNEQQKKHYSGKKKCHMLKTQISVSSTGKILDVSQTYAGSVHDKSVIDEEGTIQKFPEKTCQRLDLGYQGTSGKNPESYIVLPHKKPKGGELSTLQKELNKVHSKRRVVVENGICKVKKFKICQYRYRGPIKNYNTTFRNIAALVNLKLVHTPVAA